MSVAGGGGGGGGGEGVPAGFTVRTADRCTPREPVIVTGVDAATEDVVTVNCAVEEPTGTVTLAGTAATAALLLESETTAQQAETVPVSVTVPVEGLPPVTLVGLSASEESCGPGGAGFTLIVSHFVIPPDDAVICDQWPWQQTVLVVIVNVALLAPPGTVTLAGTVATVVSWLESETTTPPAGAAPASVTVPSESSPPVTVLGLMLREASAPGGSSCSV